MKQITSHDFRTLPARELYQTYGHEAVRQAMSRWVWSRNANKSTIEISVPINQRDDSYLVNYARIRTNELHATVFGKDDPELWISMAYFGWHKRLNDAGYGRDYGSHPRNPFRKRDAEQEAKEVKYDL